MNELRFPIGRFALDPEVTPEKRARWIEEIGSAPTRLRAAVEGLAEEQLDTRYREGGWTVRQLVHHVADSHLNAYIRFRWALTEPEPAIKAYDEKAWAELPDARSAPVAVSLDLLEALHRRWVRLLESLSDADFARPFHHPENGRMTLEVLVQLYAWHGRHHTAHVMRLRERMGWG